MIRIKEFALWAMPLLGLLAGFTAAEFGMPHAAAITLGITILTAGWWMTEAVPIPTASMRRLF